MRKRTPGELLVELRIIRRRLERDMERLDRRISTLNSIAVQSFTTVPAFSQRAMREVDQLERVKTNLVKLDVLLEMLEIRLETVMALNSFFNEIRPLVKAIKEASKSFPVPLEIAPELEEIVSEITSLAPEVPGETIVTPENEEVKRILEEAERIASIKEAKPI